MELREEACNEKVLVWRLELTQRAEARDVP